MSNSALPYHIFDACEDIDASIFTGTVLFNVATVKELKEYVSRWQRAVDEALADHIAGFYDVTDEMIADLIAEPHDSTTRENEDET